MLTQNSLFSLSCNFSSMKTDYEVNILLSASDFSSGVKCSSQPYIWAVSFRCRNVILVRHSLLPDYCTISWSLPHLLDFFSLTFSIHIEMIELINDEVKTCLATLYVLLTYVFQLGFFWCSYFQRYQCSYCSIAIFSPVLFHIPYLIRIVHKSAIWQWV